jgi:spectinomycin phosphotransferase
MQTPPTDVTSEQVLACTRAMWDPGLVGLEHLPVGFGAHHWRAEGPSGPALFLTLDPPTPRHTPQSLERAYAAAAELAGSGLEFIHASEATTRGSFTVPLGTGVLSATRWAAGERPAEITPEVITMVARLHRAPIPPGIPRWTPLVPADLDARLAAWVRRPWTAGPLVEEARALVRAHVSHVAEWLAAYNREVAALDPGTYVATHGEPGVHNLWVTDGRLTLVDWESLALAPRERDLMSLGEHAPDDADPAMLELFDLEWRLSEVLAFSEWLRGPHTGNGDDVTALEGLRDELTRPAASSAPPH